MTTTQNPTERLDIRPHTGALTAALQRLEERIELDERLKLLVKLRASQINGCAYCLDMHWTHAREIGESEVRLAQLTVWPESPFFDARERAALALADAVTLISETHVPDDVWAEATRHFDAAEIGHLLFAIAAINAWNRIAVSVRGVPASYLAQHAEAA